MPTAAAAQPSLAVRRPRRRTRARLVGLAVALVVLAVVVILSVMIGSAMLPPRTVLDALTAYDGSIDHATIVGLRLPRTGLGILVGAALACSGALMQALTRNPLADPGILGVNAGAGFAIALGVAVLGVTRIDQYLGLSFAGAVAATVVVYAIASGGRGGATPLRLTLVGVALGAVLIGASRTLALLDVDAFDRMRFWDAGTIADRPGGTVVAILPWVLAGLVIAAWCLPGLDALALGDEVAVSMGVRVRLLRAGVIVAVTLLCGAATAAAGPISFVGLIVPHAVRLVTGPDQRWIFAFSLVVGPVLVLAADVVGRLVVFPAELQVGVVAALIGAPVLVALVRRGRAAGAA